MKQTYIYKEREIRKEQNLRQKKINKMVSFVCTKKEEESFDFMMKVAKPLWMDKRFIAKDLIRYDAIVDDFGASVIANWF